MVVTCLPGYDAGLGEFEMRAVTEDSSLAKIACLRRARRGRQAKIAKNTFLHDNNGPKSRPRLCVRALLRFSGIIPNNTVEPQSTPSTRREPQRSQGVRRHVLPGGANTIRDLRPRANPSVLSPFALFASFAVKYSE